MTTKIKEIKDEIIYFENGYKLYSDHDQDCCENHFLSFNDIVESDFKDLEFNLNNDEFFDRIEGYGIELKATNNFPLRIPGYGYNNGYYSSNLKLVLEKNKGEKPSIFDVSECQTIND